MVRALVHETGHADAPTIRFGGRGQPLKNAHNPESKLVVGVQPRVNRGGKCPASRIRATSFRLLRPCDRSYWDTLAEQRKSIPGKAFQACHFVLVVNLGTFINWIK